MTAPLLVGQSTWVNAGGYHLRTTRTPTSYVFTVNHTRSGVDIHDLSTTFLDQRHATHAMNTLARWLDHMTLNQVRELIATLTPAHEEAPSCP